MKSKNISLSVIVYCSKELQENYMSYKPIKTSLYIGISTTFKQEAK